MFMFFSIRNACLFSNFPMLLADDMLITNQDATRAFLKTPQGEETNTEEGFCKGHLLVLKEPQERSELTMLRGPNLSTLAAGGPQGSIQSECHRCSPWRHSLPYCT